MERRVHILILAAALWGDPIHGAELRNVYDDAFESGWQNWSWAAVTDVSQPTHSGNRALAVNAGPWDALYLHHASQEGFTELQFWIHGGTTGGQRLLVQATLSGQAQTRYDLPALAAGQWQLVSIPLQTLGAAGNTDFDGFWIQDRSGTRQSAFYMDDIALGAGSSPVPSTNSVLQIVVDASRNRHPISDRIYGVAFASQEQLQALHCPLHRSGGNAESRYNWQLNAHNRGFDWYFESLADPSPEPGAEADAFVAESRAAGADPMLTVPLIGWVARLGPNRGRLASYSIEKYGPQTGRDAQWFPDAGNGVSASNGTPIRSNDPGDASVLTDVPFQEQWVRHLTNRWGTAGNGGVVYYLMDNEPSLWHSTHRDVHPTGTTMVEIRDKILQFAAAVKAIDPSARVAGPEEWGWSGYFYSGYDQQWGSEHGWSRLPDRAGNGGWDYLPWLLDQVRQRSEAAHQRLLDVFTVHYYPQGGEYGDDVSASTQRTRNRSTRALWDPQYLDPTWINDKVQLIPRLKHWVATYYPGTQIGITEYNWGAEAHINGATAQADLLGIFGREGLDLATRWTTPKAGTPTFKAMQLYRNYDGRNSTFGDVSVSAQGPDPDVLSVFAAERIRDQALTIVTVNKTNAVSLVELVVTNAPATSAVQFWQLTAANEIARLPDRTLDNGRINLSLPAQSVTLLVIPGSERLRFRNLSAADGQWRSLLSGGGVGNYVLQQSADLKSWTPVLTNRLDPAGTLLSFPLESAGGRFYRAVQAP